jgi:hypothetical protein
VYRYEMMLLNSASRIAQPVMNLYGLKTEKNVSILRSGEIYIVCSVASGRALGPTDRRIYGHRGPCPYRNREQSIKLTSILSLAPKLRRVKL